MTHLAHPSLSFLTHKCTVVHCECALCNVQCAQCAQCAQCTAVYTYSGHCPEVTVHQLWSSQCIICSRCRVASFVQCDLCLVRSKVCVCLCAYVCVCVCVYVCVCRVASFVQCDLCLVRTKVCVCLCVQSSVCVCLNLNPSGIIHHSCVVTCH